MYKFIPLSILTILVALTLVCAQDVKINEQELQFSDDATERIVTKHLQDTYFLNLFRTMQLKLTGFFIKDFEHTSNQNTHKTYTVIKYEF